MARYTRYTQTPAAACNTRCQIALLDKMSENGHFKDPVDALENLHIGRQE